MHIKNYTKAQKGHILTHNENAEVRAKLKNVDKDLTKNNYNLCERDIKAIEYWEKRFNESKHSNQKKTAVMSDLVLTEPKGLTEEQSKQFFKESYSFLSERYGKENIISAWVHCDEPDAQRHMHLCLLPINKETNRCSARGVFSKEELQSVHTELQEHLDISLDFSAKILNGATSGGNKSIEQLKAEKLQKENQELNDRLREERIKLNFLQRELGELQEENQKEETRNKAIKEVYSDVQDRLMLEKENQRLTEENRELKAQVVGSVSEKEYNELYNQAELMANYISKTGQEERFVNFANSRYSEIENDL